MRIGFDAKRAFFNSTGLGNYSRTLIGALAQYFPEEEYFLYSPSTPAHDPFQNSALKVITPQSFHFKSFPSIWRSVFLHNALNRDKIDIFHGLSHEIPFSIYKNPSIKSIVTIHDLIFLKYPQLYPFIDRNIYLYKFRYSCQNADRIIAISEQTKKDIIELLQIQPEKIEVVYQSCHPVFQEPVTQQQQSSMSEKYRLPQKFLLYVGSITERKNVLNLVKAVEKLKSEIPLIIIGNGNKYRQKTEQYIHQKNLSKKVIILDNVPSPHLPAIYNLATIFIYPSAYEGFGIPIIEALNCHTPVITTSGGCFSEAGGPGALYIDHDQPEAITEAIERLLTNENIRQKLAHDGFEWVKKFNAKSFAINTMKIYKEVKEQ